MWRNKNDDFFDMRYYTDWEEDSDKKVARIFVKIIEFLNFGRCVNFIVQ